MGARFLAPTSMARAPLSPDRSFAADARPSAFLPAPPFTGLPSFCGVSTARRRRDPPGPTTLPRVRGRGGGRTLGRSFVEVRGVVPLALAGCKRA